MINKGQTDGVPQSRIRQANLNAQKSPGVTWTNFNLASVDGMKLIRFQGIYAINILMSKELIELLI